MAARKDITTLLRKARAQGFTVSATGSGHWRVTNEATGASIVIPATPRGGHTLRNVIARLRRIDFTTHVGTRKNR